MLGFSHFTGVNFEPIWCCVWNLPRTLLTMPFLTMQSLLKFLEKSVKFPILFMCSNDCRSFVSEGLLTSFTAQFWMATSSEIQYLRPEPYRASAEHLIKIFFGSNQIFQFYVLLFSDWLRMFGIWDLTSKINKESADAKTYSFNALALALVRASCQCECSVFVLFSVEINQIPGALLYYFSRSTLEKWICEFLRLLDFWT